MGSLNKLTHGVSILLKMNCKIKHSVLYTPCTPAFRIGFRNKSWVHKSRNFLPIVTKRRQDRETRERDQGLKPCANKCWEFLESKLAQWGWGSFLPGPWQAGWLHRALDPPSVCPGRQSHSKGGSPSCSAKPVGNKRE